MAPGFFAKLTRPGSSSNASPGNTSPRQSHSRNPSGQKKLALAQIRVTPAPDPSPTADEKHDEVPSDGGSSLNVTVVPPSPSVSLPSEISKEGSSQDLRKRTSSLAMPPRPAQPPSPTTDGELTPMPNRNDSFLRQARSTGSLRADTQLGGLDNSPSKNSAHTRYATLASPQPSNTLPKRASNSSLTVSTSKDKFISSSPSEPLVESPTSAVPPIPTITKSFTTNNVSYTSNTFLSPKPKDSDAASIRSVSSTRSRSFFSSGTFDSIKKTRSKSPKRKPTGLASAIAISGLAVAMSPQTDLAEQVKESAAERGHTRNRSVPSVNRHDNLASSLELPGNASGNRSRAPSFLQASDYPSDNEGTDDESSDDVDDVTADLMPVTGFAVASSKRNADFHELFPDIPEGDYLIEGALHPRFVNMGRRY